MSRTDYGPSEASRVLAKRQALKDRACWVVRFDRQQARAVRFGGESSRLTHALLSRLAAERKPLNTVPAGSGWSANRGGQ